MIIALFLEQALTLRRIYRQAHRIFAHLQAE